MFDRLTCKWELPKEYASLQNKEFQTKHFECMLDDYIITKEGRLIRKAERNGKEWVDTEYHGDLGIWAINEKDTLQTITLRFTHGKIEGIIPNPQTY
mgnify:CR=1 FL=1